MAYSVDQALDLARRAIEWLRPPPKVIRETIYPSLLWNLGVDPEDRGFRRVGKGVTNRDLSPLVHDRALAVAYALYQTNPYARRATQLNADFVVGDGFWASAGNGEVEVVLDELWSSNVSDLDIRIPTIALEFGLYGEQIWPVFVGADGLLRFGSIDPILVRDVAVDPDNATDVLAIKVAKQCSTAEAEWLPVIRRDRRAGSPTFGQLVGAPLPRPDGLFGVFFFRTNNVSNATRGLPDMLPAIDWLAKYDELLYNLVQRAALMNALLWDVTVTGSGEAVDKLIKQIREDGAPGANSIRAHNEKVSWKSEVPDFGATENANVAKLIRNQILVSFGFPEHYFAEGGDVNLATATAMGEPVRLRLQSRQRVLVSMLSRLAELQIQVALQKGRLDRTRVRGAELEFQIHAEPVGKLERSRQIADLQAVSINLALAQTEGWITPPQAAEMYAAAVPEAGLEVPEPKQVAFDALAGTGLAPVRSLESARLLKAYGEIRHRIESKRSRQRLAA